LLATVVGLAIYMGRICIANYRNYAVNKWYIFLGIPVCQLVFHLEKAFQYWKCQWKKSMEMFLTGKPLKFKYFFFRFICRGK